MLKPAQLYEEEIKLKKINGWYNKDNIYYYGGTGGSIISFDDNNIDSHDFASVDKDDNVIGYIGYYIDWKVKMVYGLSIISFDKGNLKLIKDLYQAIEDCFFKYNFNRIEWFCYSDNPAIRGYIKFIERCGGIQSGYCRQNIMLQDGKLHDTISFEIMKDEFKPIKRLHRS